MRRRLESERGSVAFILFAFIGLFIAAGLFFIVFITSQKASTPNPRANLHLVAPSVRPLASPADIVFPTPKLLPSPKTNPIPTETSSVSSPTP